MQTSDTRVSLETQNRVYSKVMDAAQPITAREIQLALATDGVIRSKFTVGAALRALITGGYVVTREETDVERRARAVGRKNPQGQHSLLYWPSDAPMPERTLASVIEGVFAPSTTSIKHKPTRRKTTRRPGGQAAQTGGPEKKPATQTGNRLDRLELEVKNLRQLVSDLIKVIG